MSKILFVCNFFNNPNKVSSQRTTHLVNTLKDKDLDVEVLISGEEDSFESSVMTLDEAKTSNTLSFILNYFNYKKKLIELSKKYDLIILSVPRFSLLYFFALSLKGNTKILLDLRDQLQLQELNRESRSKIFQPLIKILDLIDRNLFSRSLKYVDSIVCVGEYSKKHLVTNFKKQAGRLPVYNVHNGFLINDLKEIKKKHSRTSLQSHFLDAALVGTISSFRDSLDLRNDLRVLSKELVRLNKKINLKHWGRMTKDLEKYISSLENIEYQPQGFIGRNELLKQINLCSFSILVTSKKLKWEPTTTVFDYILCHNPILMLGGRNNEANRIINDVNHQSFFAEEFSELLNSSSISVNENINKYSREYNANLFYEALIETLK
ncbi:hypothetical protein ABRZ87_07460 [Vibrio vulnificus]|uniref:hypothetical protein n=1 Tax=Vibrio vulnificus TaxID=672 RepID=UPI001A24BA44|nr:hypothetical protein [Vibrio vulnificus]ELK8508825.1 hypothetical protein [Vibrio vulnificus]ELK8995303.1 hypothetical protein [Vibrio vulnificus]HAS6089101.1 hypothetical protein [Vibrio vulnificus]HDY7838870.1 hypothetical protein [Vibrio vulnificus]